MNAPVVAFSSADGWMLVAIVLLLMVLVFLALAEMSLSQLTKPRADAIAESGSQAGKALARLAADPGTWVNPLLLTVNACQTVQATLTGLLAGRLFGPAGVAAGVLLNVVVFFVLAEAVPKTYAVLYPVKGALLTGRPVSALVRFWPLRAASGLLIRLTNVIVRGKGLERGPFIGEREFLGMVEEAAKESVIEHEERELIESVIEFGDTTVREVMVPRPDIVSLDEAMRVTEALDAAVAEGFSRFPVSRNDGDSGDLVGVVYVKDLVSAERSGRGGDAIGPMVRDVDVVPENQPVAEVMRSMQSSKSHMALVADEYGEISGLVTLEDCLEELVGEIVDEHDEVVHTIREVAPGEYLLSGSLPVAELNEAHATGLPEDRYDTVGGFVFGVLGRVPSAGEGVSHGGWRLTVEAMDGRRIQQVRIAREVQ